MDFMTGFPISASWKGNSYNLILVIVNQFIKMIYYKPVKITINILGLAKVIINMIMHYHGVLKSIVTN